MGRTKLKVKLLRDYNKLNTLSTKKASSAIDRKYKALVKHFRSSFFDFCTQTLKIRNKAGELVPFEPNRMQRQHFNDDILPAIIGWANGTKKDPLYLCDLKGRQMGDSTLIQAACFWLCTLWSFKEGLTVAHDKKSSAHLLSMQQKFNRFSPFKLKIKRNNRGELYFGGIESKITITSADDVTLGRSYTYSFVHLSEFAFFEAIQKPETLLLGLYQAIPNRPWTFVFIETTANGEGYFKDFWFNVDGCSNLWKKCFISWLADDEYSRDIDQKDYFKLSDDEDSVYGNELTESEHIRHELLHWYPIETANLAWLDHEIMRRLNWRRWMIDNKTPGRNKDFFRQEYPTTDHDAFMASGLGVFNSRLLMDLKEARIEEQQEEPVKRYRWIGGNDFLTVTKADSNWAKSCWKESSYGHLEIFELPIAGVSYVLGADPSEGLEKSNDAGCSIWRLPEMEEVATFDDTPDPEKFGMIIASLSKWYNNALAMVEFNNHGATVTLVLTKLRARQYYRKEFDDVTKRVMMKVGWKTTSTTKPIMINALRAAIDDGRILPRSTRTIDQWKWYQRKVVKPIGGIFQEINATYGPPPGKEAGLVISGALALQAALVPNAIKVVNNEEKPTGMTADWWGRVADNPFTADGVIV